MKLRIKIDAPEDGEPPLKNFSGDEIEKFERVLEAELPLLSPQLKAWPEAEISLSFPGREEMKDVNEQYRGVAEPTDVLSFPLWEDGQFAPPSALGVLPLGDIVICPEETEREHAPMPREEALCLVLAHGFLHLLGWDHDTPEKEAAMWERQGIIQAELIKAVKLGEGS